MHPLAGSNHNILSYLGSIFFEEWSGALNESYAGAAALDHERALFQVGVDGLVDPEQAGPMAYSTSTVQFKACTSPCQPHAYAFQNLSLTGGFTVSSEGVLKYGLSIPVPGMGPDAISFRTNKNNQEPLYEVVIWLPFSILLYRKERRHI